MIEIKNVVNINNKDIFRVFIKQISHYFVYCLMKKTLLILILVFITVGCGFWTNFTTYFNTYYNAQKLIDKTEQEFSYYEEKDRTEPRALAPDYEIVELDNLSQDGIPHFMQEFVIGQAKLQPVKVKLDSVLIKGSKILARKSKSDYVEGTLYLMALAYFYKGEWLPSQVKCGELIDVYPDGVKSPDAHLLFAKSLIIQRKWDYGLNMLSRTVDIAWQLERYDILSEAFRLQADISLYKGEKEEAMKPYLQAISQTSDKELQAKWQIEMASLLYELRQFDRAEMAFAKANEDYRPDYLGMFEAYLYEAESAARQGKFNRADEILTKIEKDSKYEEWKDFAYIGRMDLLRLKYNEGNDTTGVIEKILKAETVADSAYPNNKLYKVYQYERAMENYFKSDYANAENYFAKSRSMRSSVFSQSNAMYSYMTTINKNRKIMNNDRVGLRDHGGVTQLSDLSNTFTTAPSKEISNAAYNIARTYEKLKEPDSMLYYYEVALERSDTTQIDNARYLYAVAINIQEKEPRRADSLLQLVVDRFPLTEYGVATSKILGFTEAYALDSAKEYFKSGTELRQQKMFKESIIEYKNCFILFPNNEFAPKSVYSVAFIFENGLNKLDSALYYYKLLQEKYPTSEFAKELDLSILYLDNKVNGTEIPDSLKFENMKKKLVALEQLNNAPIQIYDPKNKEENKSLLEKAKSSFKNFFKETLESTTSKIDSAKAKYDKIKDMDMDSLNFQEMLDPKQLLPTQDSTKLDSTKQIPVKDSINIEKSPADSLKKK